MANLRGALILNKIENKFFTLTFRINYKQYKFKMLKYNKRET